MNEGSMGKKLDDSEKFLNVVRSLKAGDKVNLSLYYGTKTRNIEFTLHERPILSKELSSEIPRTSAPVKKALLINFTTF